MPHHATSLLYVCIISGFNQPELEACLTHKPDDLILIVSNDKHIQNAATRFTEVLQADDIADAIAFMHYLENKGIVARIRRSRGRDIDAACGQLVGQVADRTRRSAAWQQSIKDRENV